MRRLLLLSLLTLFSAMVFAQTRTVTGTVTDDAGHAVVNASVIVKGTSTGTSTNADGKFSLSVPANRNVLEISAVGLADKEVVIGSQTNLVITLTKEEESLDEVVVTGYSAIRRGRYAGAASVVSSADMKNVAVTRFDQMLQGLAPGVQIFTGSGQPGSNNMGVVIRGVGSINGGSTPLYIMDGVPIEAAVFSAINPADVETMSILKDASSKALYGARGANGVIVITTKRGRSGKISINYSGQIGTSDRARSSFNMMNSEQYLKLEEDFKVGPGWRYSPNNPANKNLSQNVKDMYARVLDTLRNTNTDWSQLFFRKGSFQDHNLNLSGGNETLNFFISGNYHDEKGIAINSDFKRYSVRSKVNYSKDKLAIGFNVFGGYTTSNFIQSEYALALANPYAAVYLGLPYENPFAPDGSYLTTLRVNQLYGSMKQAPLSVQAASSRTGTNALARAFQAFIRNNQLKTTANFDVKYLIYNGVNVFGSYGYDFRETVNTSGVYPGQIFSTDKKTSDGSLSKGLGRMLSLSGRTGIGYDGKIGTLHEISAQAFFEANRLRTSGFNYTGYGINPKLLNTPAGITPGSPENGYIPVVGGSQLETGLNSYVGSLVYTFAEKYNFNGVFRYDGSSQVAKKNLWHPFFSLGFKWNVGKENIFVNNKNIDQLQLRLSYGTTANANGLSAYGALAYYNQVSYAGTPGLAVAYPGNSEYDWEYSEESNVGVDFGFFKNRLKGSVDVYNRNTRNLFLSQFLSYTTGFSSLQINAGKMRNRGIEIGVEGDVIKNKSADLVWTLGVNFSYNQNKITDLGQASEYPFGTAIIKVGLPLGTHSANKWGGVDQATGTPLYYTKDGVLTTNYSAADEVAEFGTNYPPTMGGFSTKIYFKGIYAKALFSFVDGYKMFSNETYFLLNGSFVGTYNQDVEMATYWKKPGDVTSIPKPGSARQFNSFDILDASYLRFRTLEFGYALPESVLKKIKFSGVQIFLSGQNLFTWTRKGFKGFDPEFNTNLQRFGYPPPKTITFGLNVSL